MSKETQVPAIIATALPEFTVTIPEKLLELRDEYVMEAGFITEVTSEKSKMDVTAQVAKIKGLINDVEKGRKSLKAPFWNAGVAIDKAAESALKGLESEVKRIESLLGNYQKEQLRKAQEERLQREQAARAEQERLARLQREQEEAERRAEQARKDAEEAARRAEEAKGKKAREEAERKAREAQALAQQAETQAQQAQDVNTDAQIAAGEKDMPPGAIVTEKIRGASVKPSYAVEVLAVLALYEAGPEAVELVPRAAFIKQMINQPGAKHDIAGLRITEEVKVAVRGVSGAAAGFLS